VFAQTCSVGGNTALPCAGLFRIGASDVPMLYLTEDASAWVAVKYTTSNSAVMVENQWNASSRNYYVSQSILASAISVDADSLMVESRSSVYSSMSNAAAFSAIRDNILNGCHWFRDTHAVPTFSSNQNQTPHQSLLQAWQDKSSASRPKNQGLLICSTELELAASPSSFFTVVEAPYSINQAHIDFPRVFFHLAIFFCLMQMAITFDAFILIRAVLLRFVNVFHHRSRPRGFNLGLIAFSVFASSLSLGVMGQDYFIEVSSLKALS